MGMKNTEATTKRYSIIKLAVRREGWALFDSVSQSTVPGTRSATKREVKEAAAELGITL